MIEAIISKNSLRTHHVRVSASALHGTAPDDEKDALAKFRSTDHGDRYFRTAPRFETGGPRCACLNQSIFVAEGRVGCGRVEYRV
jgi:hypothetical protein